LVTLVNLGFSQYYAKVRNYTEPDAVALMTPGKNADMAYAMSTKTKVLFLDVARDQASIIQYGFLESLKNGVMFKAKYESQVVYFDCIPHVVVMMNEIPCAKKLSKDRFHVNFVECCEEELYRKSSLYDSNDNDRFFEIILFLLEHLCFDSYIHFGNLEHCTGLLSVSARESVEHLGGTAPK
jgi:hypothetical protein